MTRADKELLFKDLCMRLPYGVNVHGVFLNYNKDKDKILYEECDAKLNYGHLNRYESLKPYLRPMSSMTEEEWKEYQTLKMTDWVEGDINGVFINAGTITDWLNKYHFDYRGLIPKGLAIEVNENNNPYK